MLARDGSGAVVLVRGGLPGEQVLVDTEGARIRPVRSVLVPSPARRVPPCQDAGRCGGCAWMHATSAAQATLAQEVVQDAFARLAGIDCSTVLDGPLRSVAASGYRMVARLAATRSGTLGYRPWHESVPVEVTRCVVLREDLEAVRRAVRVVGDGEVVLRGDDEGMVVVLPRPGVEVRRAPKDASVVPAGVEAPQLRLRFSIAGRWWSSRPTSFAQPSSAGAALLAEAVSDFAGRPRRLLDAYAGIGVLGGVVAERTGAALVAVEANRGAALDAEENLADLGAVVLAGRMERHVGALVDAHVDVVVADPPRSGLRAEGSAALASLEAPAIVLVGCEPAAHARDVALLVRAGYRPSAMRLLGLFPETHHVEVVTRLERRSPGSGSPRR
jgi:tRNA/tmRNA/rRNA uracil-C5-methylase (TrmA/RlmC/RlmD family)